MKFSQYGNHIPLVFEG